MLAYYILFYIVFGCFKRMEWKEWLILNKNMAKECKTELRENATKKAEWKQKWLQ